MASDTGGATLMSPRDCRTRGQLSVVNFFSWSVFACLAADCGWYLIGGGQTESVV